MRDAAVTLDLSYRTEGHASAEMEPHASIARWEGYKLTLRGSYQMVCYNAKELADSLEFRAGYLRPLAPYVGGGLGSKLGITHDAVAAALASQLLGRPVRVSLTRQQDDPRRASG